MDQKLDFNVDPYFDDFEATGGAKEENYHRVLFRPGFPVQARELTQLQTVLQNQIERFGDHIFENGAQVIPGDVNIDTEYRFVKLQSTFNTTNVENYRQNFYNKIITGSDTGVKARVIGTLAATSSDPITLYIKYENSGTDGDTKIFKNGETITTLNSDNTVKKNPELSADQTTELSASLLATGATGTGSAVKVHAGIYYINGFFVKNDEQVIILDKYTNSPNYRVGFRVVQNTITPEDDENLKDNATGSSNYAAPGAHRYQIELTLAKIGLDSTDDKDFVELARIVNGLPEQVVKNTNYSVLERTLARRTFDESGNYEVRKFGIDVREHLNDGSNFGIYSSADNGDDSKLAVGVEPGKAYISGYEIETIATKYLDVPKARTFARAVDTPIKTPLGNYVLVQNLKGYPNFASFEQVNLVDDFRGNGGSVVGVARVRGIQLHSGDYTAGASTVYRLGLFDIQMNEGKSFENDVKGFVNSGSTFEVDVKASEVKLTGTASITSGSTALTGVGTLFNSQLKAGDYLYVEGTLVQVQSVTDNLNAVLSANASATVAGGSITKFTSKVLDPSNKKLVFPIEYARIRKLRGDSSANPDNVKSTAYTVRRILTDEVSGTGTISITLDGQSETYESVSDLSNYTLVVESTTSGTVSAGDIIPITTGDISLSGNDRTVEIANLISTYDLVANDSLILVASVRVSGDDGDEKSKTLHENHTKDVTAQADVEKTELLLGKADIFRLVSVQMQSGFGAWTGTGAIDITDRYDLDDGQRDAFYDIGRVKLRPGQPVPTGSVRVTFDYFSHGAGDYFSVDSYTGQIDYEDIPNFQSSGNNGQTFELRDCLDFRPRVDDTGAGFTLGTASVSELPKIGENVESDFSYYLPRIDKVYVDEFGVFSVLQGVPSLVPQPPKDPESGMVLYQMSIPAYTLNTKEVVVKSFDNKRYTMRDIGKLEKRIENLEYYTTLNMLEKETADLQIKDADGFDRFKNGFIVDPFTGHGVGDVQSKDYRVSVDFTNKECRPMHFTENVRLVESATSNADRSNANYQRTGDLITLPYEHTNFINNPYATDAIDVNPYKIAAYTGEIELVPPSDEWKDTTRRPDLVVQDDNNFDALQFMAEELGVTGTRWNEWQDEWSGQPEVIGTGSTFQRGIGGGRVGVYQNITLATQVGQVREGERTQIVPNTINQNLGDRIVNISMIPYIRSRPVTILAQNLKPDTKLQAFFDSENVTNYIRPADIFTITADDRSLFEFNEMPPAGFDEAIAVARQDDDGNFQQAYAFGDVIKNQTHSAVSITNVAQPSAPGLVNVTVTSTSGISVGHHVQLSGVGGSTELNYTVSKGNTYLVTAVSGNVVTIKNLDESNISTITAFTSGGSLQRLQASAVVAYQSYDNPDDEVTLLPVDIFVINVKNGFGIGDVCEGTLLNANGVLNQCEIAGINGTTSSTVIPSLKKDTDDLFSSDIGNFIGVYTIPNSESVRFRTGNRVLRLIDSLTNNLQTGLFSTKAEEIYYATGIAETREATILSTKTAKFVRDRVEERREVRRVTQSNRFLRSFVPPAPSGGGNSGGGGGGHDPLSQTFVVNTPGGAFVTKVDLFFNTRGTRPMIVEIRNVVDGIPSFKILPMAQTTLRADQLNISDNGTVATTFTFPSPIYLQQGEEYSLTVKTDEPGARIFFSEVGQLNLADNRIVSVNPLVGTFFLSQNGSVQTPHQLRDMKFNLYRANFDTTKTATVDFQSVAPSVVHLKTNPFEMTNGTGKVRVIQRNHGFGVGDTVTISGVADGNYGGSNLSQGIPADVLNGDHTITSVDMDSYVITIASGDILGTESALSKGFYGGTGVKATRNILVDVIQPTISQIKLTDTAITYDMQIIDQSYDYSPLTNIIENDNFYFSTRKMVCSAGNQSAQSLTNSPLILKATLTSTNPAVSPVIDTTRVSAFCVANRINNVDASDINDSDIDSRTIVSANANVAFTASSSKISTADATTKAQFQTLDIGKVITVTGASNSANNGTHTVLRVEADGSSVTVDSILTDESAGSSVTMVVGERFLADIAPEGASNEANYATRRFNLDDPATAFKIIYDANRPSGTTLEVYYKIIKEGEDVPFKDIPFVKAEIDVADTPDANTITFKERSHTVENLDAFTSISVKVVMKSVDTTVVPRIKNLRVIALAV